MSTALQTHIAKQSPMYFTRNCFDRPLTSTDSVEIPAFLKAENMSPEDRRLLKKRLRALAAPDEQ